MFPIQDPHGVNSLSRLNFVYLNEHKFRHKFKECVSPMFGCGLDIEPTQHLFLRCHFYHVEMFELLNSLYDMKILLSVSFYLAQISIIRRQIENYFLTVLLISKLLKDLMNHFYDQKQFLFLWVMYILVLLNICFFIT